MSSEKMRLFIGITFDSKTLDLLDEVKKQLEGISRKGKFTRKENLHLTLVFLGDTDPERVRELDDLLGELLHEGVMEPFEIELSSIGSFRKQGGDVYWVGVLKNERLTSLQSAMENGLRKRGFQFEERAYVPHLTLGRGISLNIEGALQDVVDKMVGMKVRISSVCVMWSHREKEVLQYTPIRVREFCHSRYKASGHHFPDDSNG